MKAPLAISVFGAFTFSKGSNMFFPFLAAAGTAAAFAKLGAMSVQVTVLTIALKVITAAVVAGLIYFMISNTNKT